MALENLGNPLDLVLQSPALASSEPDEWLDGHLNLAAGATLVPDASDHALGEQDRIVAGLAGRRERAGSGLTREEPGSRMAADGVRIEVRQQQDAASGVLFGRHVGVAARHPRRRTVEVDLGQLSAMPLELLGCPRRRSTNPLRELLRRGWPVRIQVARDHRGNGFVWRGQA